MSESPTLGGRAQAELRRLLALSFSPSELVALAEALGTPKEGDVARELVRRATPEILLARLRELRPLVEWPELEAPRLASTVVAAPALAALTANTEGLGRPGFGDAPGDPPGALPLPSRGVLDEPTALTQRPAERVAQPGALPEPTEPPSGALVEDSPPGVLPSRTLARTVASDVPKKGGGFDSRLFALVGVLTLVAGLIAFVAGRSFRQGDKSEPRVSIRRDGATDRVKTRFDKSLLQVARDCEVVGGRLDEPTVFERALERCGKDMARPKPLPEPPKPERSVLDLPPEPGGSTSADAAGSASVAAVGPTGQAPNPQAPNPQAPARRPEGGTPRPQPKQPRPPGEPDRGCVSRCESGHRSCKSACGAEPQQASQYQAYQGCLTRCLASASQCRLGCK